MCASPVSSVELSERNSAVTEQSTTADQELPVIARFEVRRRSYLAPDGKVLRQLPAFAADADVLRSLYRGMVLTRTFDLKAVSLQRTGRLGTYAVSLGQEGVSVGVASAMREEDVIVPSYRDNGALLWRGMKMEEILLFWGGDERGNRSSGPAHDLPYCIPVGSQAPHAAMADAIADARAGKGPRLIEALTYRLSDHTTADDAGRYRPAEEVQARWKEEPIARLRSYLVSQKVWGKSDEEELVADCQQRVEAAVERYLAVGPRAPETMFDYLYAELPKVYASQREQLKRSRQG